MSFALKEVVTDANDSSIIHVTLVNTDYLPHSVAILGGLKARGYTEMKDAPKELRLFRVFMVTRRSIANPDETVKLRVHLAAPMTDFPAKAYLQLAIHNDFVKIKFDDVLKKLAVAHGVAST